MAFCKYCGKPVEEGFKLCPYCGAATENSDAQGSQAAQSAIPAAAAPQNGEYDAADIEKTRIVCAISYISILFFLPLVAYPDSRFGKFHANQALLLLIATVIISTAASIAGGIFGAIPFIPDFLRMTTSAVLNIASGGISLAGMIFGIVNAANGKAKELPLIGGINLINK